MRNRHRIPTIFNLSMVDVLCCALGCVLLLWLLNLREAKERATTVGQTNLRLEATLATLHETESRLQKALQERDRLAAEVSTVKAELAGTVDDLAKLHDAKKAVDARMVQLTQDQKALSRQKAEAEKDLADLDSRLHDRDEMAKLLTQRAERLTGQLEDAGARIKDLQRQANLVPSLRKEAEEYRSKLANVGVANQGMESRLTDRDRKLAVANRTIETLRDDKRSLTEQMLRARFAAENRFEGIALTGRRVLFLVDMSGSMDLVSEQIPAPNKWTGVRETVAKIMRSLPDLEKFQVIVFSERSSFLLGNDELWFDFDAKKSVDQVASALAQTRPRGGTNMYEAFERAFRLRASDLDTIYVFSDGLPNLGPGLTPEQERNPKENERSEILARHIRDLLARNWNRPIVGQARVRINTVGFFFESPDVGAFLWALARENDGSFVGMSKP
jgi:hypothetical protein